MGGTRFVGKSLVKKLIAENHDIDIFTRGNKPSLNKTNHIIGDRNLLENILKLKDNRYDLIFDISGRELDQSKILLENIKHTFKRYIYVSSAGVYKDNYELPLIETDPIDSESRHKGKSETENWLLSQKIPFTSFRPTYIYGPENYNKIENWFFERIIYLKNVPMPGDGSLITQLGHVSDLTDAMIKSANYDKAKNNIYNCSGEKSITMKGLINKCIEACNQNIKDIKINSFDYQKLDPKSRKGFPIRLSNYQTSISRIKNDLCWQPKYDLISGLKDSFENDFLIKDNIKIDRDIDNLLFLS